MIMREIVLDTETTGLNYKSGDRVVEVGCVELVNHISTGNNLQFYCSVDKEIKDGAKHVHGLTNEFLNQYPTFKEQVGGFLEFIKQDTLIIHNSEFDIGFINNELKLIGINKLKNKVIDTISLARKTLDTRIANLDYLCKRFSIDLSARTFHGALLDCQLLAEVYLELLGGRQTSLDLALTTNLNVNTHRNSPKKKHTICKVKITEENIQEHKDFIADLKNALWHKVDY